jgi:hypothetical protein
VLGVLGGAEEGVELNVLGLTLGVDPDDLGLKLPFVGRVGFGARNARAETLRADE